MTVSTTSVPAHYLRPQKSIGAISTQSEEAGGALIEDNIHNVSVATQEKLAPKPWAHFVAGG